MATENNRKYYYLKLREDFFEREEIVILESMPDGFIYSNILMKLYLRSLKDAGRLMFKGVIPYTPDVLATLTRHPVGVVEKAVEIYKQLGLVEVLDNGAMFMLDVENFVGTSSTEADRVRAYRARIEQERKAALAAPQDGVHLYDKRTDEGEELHGNNSLVRMDELVQSYEHEQTGENAETLGPQGKAELSTNEAYKCTPEIENRDKRIENREDIIYNVRKDITLTVPPKAKHSASISQIVDYLNQKSGKTFRATTKATQSLIKTRLKEGFTVDDFMKVIDIKVQKWNKDKKMQDYIRPATLFGTKFESYLNEFSVENPAAEVQLEDTNMPRWAIEDRRKQERIKNNIERMPSEVREKFEKDKEEFTRIVQKNLQNITYAHMDDFEPEELTEAETAFYEEHKKFIEQLETEDIT